MMKYRVEGVLEMTRFRRGNTGGASGVVDIQVGAGVDDGYSTDSPSFSATSSNTPIGQSSNLIFDAFARFTGVTIPQGATIDSAKLIVQAKGSTLDGAGMLTNLYFEDSDDAVAPTTQGEHAADVRTTAFVAWDAEDFVVDTDTDSPDISTVVKEVVDRGSWVSGNAMMLLWDDDGSTNGRLYEPWAYDGDIVRAIKLHVEWSS